MKTLIKTLLLFALVLTELSFSSAAVIPVMDNSSSVTNKNLQKPKFSLSFIIARHRDCEEYGICNWQAGITVRTINKGNGVVYKDDASKSTLVLEINKSTGITTECYDKYFKSGVFIMEDDFPMPLEISKALEYSGQKTIPAGKHRIVEIRGLIYVYLPVK